MKTELLDGLDSEQRAEVEAFYDSLEQNVLEQLPGVLELLRDPRPARHFIGRGDAGNEVTCYARVMEHRSRGFRLAEIEFGPLFREPEDLLQGIEAVHAITRRLGFARLSISLGIPSGDLSDRLLGQLAAHLPFFSVEGDLNWTTRVLDLSHNDEALLRGMTKGHRSAVKRAAREGVQVRRESGPEAHDSFCELYARMNEARGHPVPGEQLAGLRDLLEFLNVRHRGMLLLVRDPDGRAIGGVVIVFQGCTARYYKGAADPGARHLPVLHPAIFQAMRRSRERGCRQLDLWGYNLFVGQEDPRFQINRFKKGFGGLTVDYPKVLFFPLGLRGRAYGFLRRARQMA